MAYDWYVANGDISRQSGHMSSIVMNGTLFDEGHDSVSDGECFRSPWANPDEDVRVDKLWPLFRHVQNIETNELSCTSLASWVQSPGNGNADPEILQVFGRDASRPSITRTFSAS
jgi:hypothetical protein